MGRLRLVGSLKLQVSFAEYRLFYRSLLQKRPMICRSLLIVATPYLVNGRLPFCSVFCICWATGFFYVFVFPVYEWAIARFQDCFVVIVW